MTILKEKIFQTHHNARQAAGDNQEKDVAFYLRRSFKDDPQVLVINDLNIRHEGEKAQIDHLVIHRKGFVIIESKSIYGEVKVNAEGEWSRSYKGKWSGMPSPLIQAKIQKKLLLQYLNAHAETILRKLLGFQTFFSGREWATFCSVSNSCILHRDNMPSEISKHVLKSERIAEEIEKITASSLIKRALLSNTPSFSDAELENIAAFLIRSDSLLTAPDNDANNKKDPDLYGQEDINNDSSNLAKQDNTPLIQCKQCHKADKLTPKYGKFGYYVQCGHCSSNTSMKMSCPSCGSKDARISKKGSEYSVNCDACSSTQLVISV